MVSEAQLRLACTCAPTPAILAEAALVHFSREEEAQHLNLRPL